MDNGIGMDLSTLTSFLTLVAVTNKFLRCGKKTDPSGCTEPIGSSVKTSPIICR